MLRSRLPSRRIAALAALLCCAVALSMAPGRAPRLTGSVAAAAAPEYQISQATLDDLADVQPGDRVHVDIQATVPAGSTNIQLEKIFYCPTPFPGNTAVSSWGTQFCSPGKTDMPDIFLSDPAGLNGFNVIIPPEGENTFSPAKGPFSCEPGNTCVIAFQFDYTPPGTTKLSKVVDVTSLAFTPKAPSTAIVGCGAPQQDRNVDALGPERLRVTGIRWAQDRCQKGSGAQDLTYTALDDTSARDAFREGATDVFFGAGGVTSTESAEAAAKRASVAVPYALNAEVIAVTGKFGGPSSADPRFPQKRPADIDDVKFAPAELATWMRDPSSADLHGPLLDAQGSFLTANPQIKAVDNARRFGATIAANVTPEPGHWYLTHYLAQHAAAQWQYPDGESAGKPIGDLWDLSSLNPGGSDQGYNLVSNRSGLNKALEDFDQECKASTADNGCLNFVLTDAATAAELRLPLVKLRNPAGEYVAPTPQSMAAAVGEMTKTSDGTLIPNPDVQNKNAYPLTYVEYAYAPAQGAVDASCRPTDKQKLINDMISYLDSDGQQKLADGLTPLPAALSSTAGTARQQVGAQKPANCAAGTNPDDVAGGGDGAGVGGGDVPADAAGSDVPGDAATTPSSAGALGNHATRPVTTGGQQQALRAANNARIPLFAGLAALALLIPLSALAFTNGLTSGTAFGASGRRLPPRLARALSTVAGWGTRLYGVVAGFLRRVRSITSRGAA